MRLTLIPSTSTKQGFDQCPECQNLYSMHWKPVPCKECGFHVAGTKEPRAEMSVITTKTSTRDDRCFVMKEGDSVFCMHKECMNVCATFVSSGRASDFVCKHSDQYRDVVPVQKLFELTTEKMATYNRDSASKELLTELLGSESNLAVVVQVSDVSFHVNGFPSTNNTLGYSHAMIADGVLICSSKDTDCI